MIPFRATLVLAVCASAGVVENTIPADEYAGRRAALRRSVSGVMLVAGATERETGDLRSGFIQDSHFYYLTGWKEPGAILLMTPSEETFFLPERNDRRERYTGKKAAPGDPDIRKRTGFERVLSAAEFSAELRKATVDGRPLYAVKNPAALDFSGVREAEDLAPAIGRLRSRKSASELRLIQRAVEASIEAHRAAWKRIRPGAAEYQVAASLVGFWLDRGCERSAYPPIVASGPNGVILHYNNNSRSMDRGDLVLIDAGAECSGYTADLTRTLPVSGRFTPRQRELYDIVLAAQKAAIEAVRPGATLRGGERSLYQAAFDYINTHGKDRNGRPLGQYLLHGVSHHVGLDVHDASDPSAPLEEGMVITIEPGIYIAEENIGIRIEDMVVVTADGARVLSASLPRKAEEMEKAVAR